MSAASTRSRSAHGAVIVVMLGSLAAGLGALSNPSPNGLYLVAAAWGCLAAGVGWMVLAIRYLTRARPVVQRRAWWFLVAPMAAIVGVSLAITNTPLETRWNLARHDFEQALNNAPPHHNALPSPTGGAPFEPENFAVPRRLGSFNVQHASRVPAGVFFHTGGGGIGFSDGGFAHLTKGPPGGLGPLSPRPELGGFWFESITFHPLGDGWYAWSAVQ